MQNDLISVIVPVYNIEQYVGICIESLIKQTYTDLEIIVVDDGSTDRSSALCDLYANKDKRIKVIHKQNGGLVSARKVGVAIANGKYIGYVDGDDWVEPDYYEMMYRSAVKADADTLYGLNLLKKFKGRYIPYVVMTDSKTKKSSVISPYCTVDKLCLERALKAF